MSLTNAGEVVSPAILKLVREVTPMVEIRTKLAAAAFAMAVGLGAVMFPAAGAQPTADKNPPPPPVQFAVAAEPATPQPTGLEYVPADAAFFLHADAAKLWNGSLGKSIRAADAKTFDDLAANAKKLFGATPDALKSATIFWPSLKRNDSGSGVVLVFKDPYDKAKLKAGFEELLPRGSKSSVVSPSDRVAVLLVDLDPQTYGKPRPTDKTGPLADAIREAGTGKHLLVAGSTLANLPDEFRADNLPQAFRGVKPLLQTDSISAIIDLDKELKLEIRVKAPTAPRAQEAEKVLEFLANFAQESIGEGLKELSRDSDMKDIAKTLVALQSGLKDAKYATEVNVARATVKVPGDLPFAMAYLAMKRKVTGAAGRAQSTNNLKQIGIALHNYAEVHGALPPAAVCDKTGKPVLSWRVLILPYLEQNNLYKEFKLDEPWDSEHNKKLIVKIPKTYILPDSPTAKANETHYRVFVGNGAAFDYLKGPKFAEFTDGTSNTILVATAKDAVPWTKPDELAFEPDKDMATLLGFFAGDVCMVGFADGSVRALSKKLSKATLHGAITKAGGEVLGDDDK